MEIHILRDNFTLFLQHGSIGQKTGIMVTSNTGLQRTLDYYFFFILMAEYYSRNMQQTLTKEYLSIDAIFSISVLATYIMTGLDWYFVGQYTSIRYTMSSGSSIVAFSFFVSYFVILVVDTVSILKKHAFGENIMKSARLLFIFVFLWFLSVIGSLQDALNPNHEVGMAIYGPFALMLIISRSETQSNYKEILNDYLHCYFFNKGNDDFNLKFYRKG